MAKTNDMIADKLPKMPVSIVNINGLAGLYYGEKDKNGNHIIYKTNIPFPDKNDHNKPQRK